MATRQAPLKVDVEVDELITNSAHILGLTKKELVATRSAPTSSSGARSYASRCTRSCGS